MDREMGAPSFAAVLGNTARDLRRLSDRTVWRKPIRSGGTTGAVIAPGDGSVASVPATVSLALDPGSWSAIASGRILGIVSSPPQVMALRFRLQGGGQTAEQAISYEVLDFGIDLGASLAINFTLTAPGSVVFSGFVTATDPNDRLNISDAQLSFADLTVFAR